MDVADVEPLLLHLPVRQDAIPGQEGAAAALAVAQDSPEARALEQEDGAVTVGEVGGVDVAARMVSAHHCGEDVPDVFWETSGQSAGVHVEGVHLREQTVGHCLTSCFLFLLSLTTEM